VEQRQRAEHAILLGLLAADEHHHRIGVCDEVGMAQHSRLGLAGRPAGILQHRDLTGRNRDRRRRTLGLQQLGKRNVPPIVGRMADFGALEDPVSDRLQRRQRAGDRASDDVLHAHLASHFQHPCLDFGNVAGRDDRRARVLQQMRQFALDVEGVHVDDDPAGLEDREEQDRVIGRVRQAQRDSRALHDAEILEPARGSVDRLAEFGIGHRPAHEIEHVACPEPTDRRIEHVAQQAWLAQHGCADRNTRGNLLHLALQKPVCISAHIVGRHTLTYR
jgi:hypothetical protein